MSWFVYIIKSDVDGTFYKGVSENYVQRLQDHNAGKSEYTSRKRPWSLHYVEVVATKKEALIRERKLKQCKADYFEWLKHQDSNILNN